MYILLTVLYFVIAVIVFNILNSQEPRSPSLDLFGSVLWLPMLAFILTAISLYGLVRLVEFIIHLPSKGFVGLAKYGKQLGRKV